MQKNSVLHLNVCIELFTWLVDSRKTQWNMFRDGAAISRTDIRETVSW